MVKNEANGGQWVGRVESATAAEGWAVVELDPVGGGAIGKAYHFPDDSEIPSVFVDLTFPQGIIGHHRRSQAPIYTFHPLKGEPFERERMPDLFPNAWAAEHTDLDLHFLEDELIFGFQTPNSEGRGTLRRVPKHDEPEPPEQVMNWKQFVRFASRETTGRIFRGQSAPHRLRTSFHRSSRKDLVRYRRNDIPEIYRALACQLKHYFDFFNPEHTGAFYSLIQHHGYPTPLLDWTYSPFVAAFFAFERPHTTASSVRIFAFDRDAWERDFYQVRLVTFTAPHFSMIDVLSLENNRMVPQQATAALTNVDDIEYFIQFREALMGKKYLKRIDIPATERDAALAHLRLMGITAGSLFPGLDGTCRAMAAKNF